MKQWVNQSVRVSLRDRRGDRDGIIKAANATGIQLDVGTREKREYSCLIPWTAIDLIVAVVEESQADS